MDKNIKRPLVAPLKDEKRESVFKVSDYLAEDSGSCWPLSTGFG